MSRRQLMAVTAIFVVAACAPRLQGYGSELAATQGCKGDQVVWVNTERSSGIYHLRGSRYYANTSYGVFACRSEAEKFGYQRARG